jgi:hypothetical protein
VEDTLHANALKICSSGH